MINAGTLVQCCALQPSSNTNAGKYACQLLLGLIQKPQGTAASKHLGKNGWTAFSCTKLKLGTQAAGEVHLMLVCMLTRRLIATSWALAVQIEAGATLI